MAVAGGQRSGQQSAFSSQRSVTTEFSMFDAQSSIPQPSIPNLQSSIRNQQSSIRNHQSAILNPQSAILNYATNARSVVWAIGSSLSDSRNAIMATSNCASSGSWVVMFCSHKPGRVIIERNHCARLMAEARMIS